MKRPLTRTLLGLSGVILFGLAVAILFNPVDFFASSEIELSQSASLMSEIKAPAGLLLVSALILFAGAINTQLMPVALWLNILVYGSYAVGRLISITLGGLPDQSLLIATAIELAIALLSAWVLPRLA